MKKGTICVQGGYSPKQGEPRVLPIIQSTTYKYRNYNWDNGKFKELTESDIALGR